MPETPKPGSPAFERAQFQLVLGMHELFHAAHRIAESLDCEAFCDNSTDDWPVEKAADFLLAQLQELRAANPRRLVALIADGELSSTVTGDGVGGRNSAFVLACVPKIAGKRIVVLKRWNRWNRRKQSCSRSRRGRRNIVARSEVPDSIRKISSRRSDSFRFFQALGDSVVTGPTGNNLRDMRLLIALP